LIKNRRNGFTVASDDTNTFAGACRCFLMNEDLVARMGQSARLAFEDGFKIDKMSNSYTSLYKSD
jgi:glycosyltransferase involved in cell wall biosynthesis